MPTLSWIGKEKVVTHHQDVPFRVLSHKYGFVDGKTISNVTGTGNKIIHGDNLEALKSLLPEYENKVKCIYIDPPYNTGNEGWIYNDNVNDPKIKKWLNTVVGKEGEDLSRHDKWLCMMYPRLKLLHGLLADDGAIFISIDDNEHANLKLAMDDIFGPNNFVANVIWHKKYSVANDHKTISPMHDFVLVFQKSGHWQRNLLPRTDANDKQYRYSDEKGIFRPDNYTCNKTSDERPNLYYPVTNPNTGEEIWPKRTAVWRYSKERHEENVKNNLVYWGKDGTGKVPAFKRYRDSLRNQGALVPGTIWSFDEVGHTDAARKEMRAIMDGVKDTKDFATPKPSTLVERILNLSTSSASIVLDSFAGSGTTAHAVLNLNSQDNGNRRFIIVELEDYAETITAERVRRVINGYADKPGTGGGFDYYELGEPLFLPSGDLNETIPVEEIRSYVYYTETGLPTEREHNDNQHYCGTAHSTAYYFYYDKNAPTCLDRKFLSKIKTKAEQYLIYADNCLLTESYMKKKNIIFKKIPRDITRF